MSIMNEFTLSEVENVFKAPQHVLIHLCERKVVIPDIQQTEGRGKFRKFSTRNMVEFAVALELKKYQIPLLVIKALLIVLSATYKKVASEVVQQSIVTMLQQIHSYLYIYDGTYVVLDFVDQKKSVESNQANLKIILGIDLNSVLEKNNHPTKLQRLQDLPDGFTSHLRIDLSNLANRTLSQLQ